MEIGLFEALSRYSPREGNDPLENFITEGFAWLLNKYPEFGEFFLRHLEEKLREKELQLKVNKYDCEWSTQVNFNGKRPDMVYRFRDVNKGKAIVFEHKVMGLSLAKDQLKDYRKYAQIKQFQDSRIVLITARQGNSTNKTPILLCAGAIYTSSYLIGNKRQMAIFPSYLKTFRNF